MLKNIEKQSCSKFLFRFSLLLKIMIDIHLNIYIATFLNATPYYKYVFTSQKKCEDTFAKLIFSISIISHTFSD